MKKTFFTALRAMCVGAMTLFAVSCYDDSFLREDLAELEDEVAGLAARLDSLESKLNAEVVKINEALTLLNDETLAALVADVEKANELLAALDEADGVIDGRINDLEAALAQFKDEAQKQLAEALAAVAVTSVEKNEAGNYVLTFADGATLEVAAAGSTVNTGLVTTVEGEDGLLYWAVIGADGELTVLEAVVHPDTKLEFKVDPETNELLVSYDGSVWEQTGVIVNDESTINVVTSFVDGEDYVTITVGGVEYQLPKFKADNSSLVLGRADAFFMYGASKNVELQAEGVKDYYVMAKPDGWKAAIDGTTLTVTAPTEALIAMGAAETEGQVIIHATTEAGLCKVVKLDVETGEAFRFSYSNGNVNLFTAYAIEMSNFWGETMFDFVPMWVGVATIEDYLAYGSAAEFLQAKVDNYDMVGNIIQLANQYDLVPQAWYEEGVCEDLNITMSVEQIIKDYNDFNGMALEYDPESVYVLFIVPQPAEFVVEEAVCVFTGNHIKFEATSSAYDNVAFDASFIGADGYAIGGISKATFSWVDPNDESYTYEDALNEYFMGSWQPGPFAKFTSGNTEAMGTIYPAGSHTLNLSELLISDPMAGLSGEVEPNTEYFVWILPYYTDRPAEEYTLDDIILTTCKTAALELDPSVAASVEITTVDGVVSYTITPSAGGAFRYEWMDAATFEESYLVDNSISEEAVVESIGWQWPNEEVIYEEPWGVEPGQKYVLLVYSTANGYYAITATEYTVPAPEVPEFETPDGKQWIFRSTLFDEVYGGGATPDYCFDLGVSMAEQYASMGFTASLAVDYEDIYGPDAAGYWVAPLYSGHQVTPSDETSGLVVFNGMNIPYSNFTETTCSFDFSEFFMEDAGTVVVDATLAETPIFVNPQ